MPQPGREYALRRFEYALPDDWGGLNGDFIYNPNFTANYRIMPDLWENIRARQSHLLSIQPPEFYAIYPGSFAGTADQLWYVTLDPVPDAIYHFSARYHITTGELNSTQTKAAGGVLHGETLLEAICSAAENFYHENPTGPHTIRYQRLLAASIDRDKKVGSPKEIPRRCRTNADWKSATSSIRGNYIGLTNY